MDALIDFGLWLDESSLSKFITYYRWIWPGSEAAHFMGISVLFGTVAALDLRMLGMAKGVPIAVFHRLVPWAIGGFGLAAVTGLVFFVAEPMAYIPNGVFWVKMLAIALAGANVAVFYLTGIGKRVEALGPTDDAPGSAKAVAVASLVLWLGVLYLGRMLPFLGIAF